MLRQILLSLMLVCALHMVSARPRVALAPRTGTESFDRRQTSRQQVVARRSRPHSKRDVASPVPVLCGVASPNRDFVLRVISTGAGAAFNNKYFTRYSANAANFQDAIRATVDTVPEAVILRLNNQCQLQLADGRVGKVDGGPTSLSFINFLGDQSSLFPVTRPITCAVGAFDVLTCEETTPDGRILRIRVTPQGNQERGTLVLLPPSATSQVTDGSLIVNYI